MLTHDGCYSVTGIDTERWANTMHFPLTRLLSGRAQTILSREELIAHLLLMDAAMREAGVGSMRTRILSHLRPSDDLTILCSLRDSLDPDGWLMKTISITWTLMRFDTGWRITQILFNDKDFDTSFMATLPFNKGQD